MKKGWKKGLLKDIATVVHGKNQKAVESETGEYPIYGSGGTIMGYANDYLCEEGTTILGRKGTINNPVYIKTRFWNVDTAFGIVANKDFDKRFLFYFIKSQDWSKKNTGTTLPSLTQSVVLNTAISYPPLSEQQSIVAHLDASFAEIDALKAKAAEEVANAKAMFDAALREEMTPKEGWKDSFFEDIVLSNVVGLTRGKQEQSYTKQYPYFKMNNISSDNQLCWDDLVYVDASEEEINKFSLEEGDFLFNTRNSKEWVGKSAVYRKKKAQVMLYNNNIMRIRFVNSISPVFICYSFLAEFTKSQIEKIKSGTTNVWGIYYRELRKIIIKHPSLATQQRIVAKLDTLRSHLTELEQKYNLIAANCDALKQAILRETFE